MACSCGDSAWQTSCAADAVNRARPGDANGDGVVDIADAMMIFRHTAADGPAPRCPAAVDLVPDERVELDDAHSLLFHLFENSFRLPGIEQGACADANPALEPTCHELAPFFDVPRRRRGDDSIDVSVLLLSAAPIVEAWSIGVRAEGCEITGATTEGTAAAWDTDGGFRNIGYDATFVARDGAVSAVVLDMMNHTTLPEGVDHPLLNLTVALQDGPCTLSLVDDLSTRPRWRNVRSVVAAEGRSLPIAGARVVID